MGRNSIPKGILNTLEAKAAGPAKRVKVDSAPDARSREELETARGDLETAIGRHRDALTVTDQEKQNQEKKLEQMTRDLEMQVRKKLSGIFDAGEEPHAALEEIMKLEGGEGRARVMESIEKLKAKEKWHREEIARLQKDLRQVERAIHDHEADEAVGEVWQAWRNWLTAYMKAESTYREFVSTVAKARKYDRLFHARRLQKVVGNKHELPTVINLIDSKLSDNGPNMATTVQKLATEHSLRGNPFFDGDGSKRRIAPHGGYGGWQHNAA